MSLEILERVGLPCCMRTFRVSRGWMVPWEAARATAPASTSLAGLVSTCPVDTPQKVSERRSTSWEQLKVGMHIC